MEMEMNILEPSLSRSLLRLLKENKQTGGVITGEQVSTNCNKLFLVFYLYNTYILPSIGWKKISLSKQIALGDFQDMGQAS